jgi:hypothetical protein
LIIEPSVKRRHDAGGNLPTMKLIRFHRFGARDLAALISLTTVCLVVIIYVIVAIFRRPMPEGREAVYQIVSSLVGLAAGLLSGATNDDSQNRAARSLDELK